MRSNLFNVTMLFLAFVAGCVCASGRPILSLLAVIAVGVLGAVAVLVSTDFPTILVTWLFPKIRIGETPENDERLPPDDVTGKM
jgi:hypothetical protein